MLRRREEIQLKSTDQLRLMRRAGLVVAEGLATMAEAVRPGMSTLELDAIARKVLKAAHADSNFLGYAGPPPFPAVICSSRNDIIVHGIPSKQDLLAEGDLISLDFGAIVEGWHGDAAVTVEVGAVSADDRALSQACRSALWDGIAAGRVGGRLTDISHAIETSVRSAGGYGIVTGYGGHGIGSQMHMDPHLPNYGRPGRGPRLAHGMTLAIEPMITAGSADTRQQPDRWTITTIDGGRAAHWEHTVAFLEDGPWVLTAEDGGRAELARRGVQLSSLAD